MQKLSIQSQLPVCLGETIELLNTFKKKYITFILCHEEWSEKKCFLNHDKSNLIMASFLDVLIHCNGGITWTF